MKILIVEDEKIARFKLIKMIESVSFDTEIIGATKSVSETVEWFENNKERPDVIFMDVELEDGNCFEIFRHVKITSNVVMVTAFNKYAVNAFEIGCIDYLLKPVDQQMLVRSLDRCRANLNTLNIDRLMAALGKMVCNPDVPAPSYRKRFVVHINNQFIPVGIGDIAYFLSEDRANYVVTNSGEKYIINMQLDTIMEQLPPLGFFRISRYCIIAATNIKVIHRLKGGRLKIEPKISCPDELVVARARVDDFLGWITQP